MTREPERLAGLASRGVEVVRGDVLDRRSLTEALRDVRAAYYLGLPAFGPTPLPKITERWTVPRDHFIFKKSQENFERITRRRLIQIRDGHPETVQIWLAFLQKHAYFGIGMKANVWEFTDIGKLPKQLMDLRPVY